MLFKHNGDSKLTDFPHSNKKVSNSTKKSSGLSQQKHKDLLSIIKYFLLFTIFIKYLWVEKGDIMY